ncbi:YLP motif-containing protein 1-like isoform X2 [Xyrauchen texanus]|uniref:YLP motif-containing protein 1-like isoform X2 n=1 Tax=Xyrauchen texanus TaxID=154827 RepID=UPI0022421A8F|nr:YLP motif-containing protein 1-like isoform X2 [Xyrauchen texanus]
MHPTWGGYGAGHQPPPPHFGPRPHQFRGAQPPSAAAVPSPPPPVVGGFGGYGAPSITASSNFSSLQEQHLQQMQQLQQLHKKQLQSVLHHPGGGSGAGFGGGGAPPYWQTGSAAAPPNNFQDPSSVRGPACPPQPAPQEVKPPPPEPSSSSSPATKTPAPVPKEQQDYWYQQHLQNLLKLKNDKAKQNQISDNSSNGNYQNPVPPPPTEPPKSAPPPPLPKEEPPPPPPPEEAKPSGIGDTGDPAEAARLQQLQAAAAHWQQVQHQRASFQYQALMQEHGQLQQVLQQYQQVIQQPAHLQTMPMDMQLQHYEMQQQRFVPLFQEWERHFNLWLEQFQSYPHKDQLQDYEAQWRQWQEQMNSTSAHLQERVTTLRAMQHQYGTGPSYGGMMGPYGQQRLPGPDGNMHLNSQGVPSMPPPVNMNAMSGPSPQGPPPSGPVIPQRPSPSNAAEPYPSSGPDSVSEICKTAGPSGPGVRPPGYRGRFDGPRFEGPRGPRFEQPPQQRFSGPPRFDNSQRFSQPPRGNPPWPGAPARLENPPVQNPPTCFERPPAPPPPSQQPGFGPLSSLGTGNQTSKPDAPSCPPSQIDPEKDKLPQDQINKKDGAASAHSLSDDILDSGDGFFIHSGPIPQTQDNKPEIATAETSKQNKMTADSSKTALPMKPNSNIKNSPNSGSQPPKTGQITNGPPQQTKPPPREQFNPDTPKEVPRGPQVNQKGPPHATRGRGRGQGPVPLRGRGRGRGRGQYGGQMADPICQRENSEDVFYENKAPDDKSHQDLDWRDPSLDESGEMDDQGAPHEMWHPEEHHFPEEHYEKPGMQRPPMGHMEHPESTHPEEPWEEEQQDYWEEDPYWAERRPPLHARPPFPSDGPRRPPFQPRFMPHGPRRPPPPGSMDPHGPPHMVRGGLVPRFRRGGGPWGPPPRHDMRQPPPAHEFLNREPGYEEEMDREPGWPHPHLREPRHPPLPPHEIMERDIRRPPMRPPIPRDRWRRPLPHEEEVFEEEHPYGSEDDGYRRPAHEYHPDYELDDEYYHSREEWGRENPEQDYPPHVPPEHIRKDRWGEQRERSFVYEEEDRYRDEQRGPYPDGPPYRERDREPPYHARPDWERPTPERDYSHPVGDTEPHYERNPEPLPGLAPPQASETPLEQSSPGATKTVLALSQRQHEIILKAAQELKMIRELQETKKALGETANPDSTGLLSEHPPGILGLEIPQDKSALQATNLLSETEQNVPVQPLEAGFCHLNQTSDFFHTSTAPAPTPSFIAKTVDYGHGRDGGTTVERISYGERMVLRPGPVPSERPYEKEMLGRDPYFDRRHDPYGVPRDYDREWERDPYREKPPLDYERERYERDHYLRDERPPLGPRPGYRDRERDHPSRSSRDREDYNRPGYDRSSYERSLDHGSSGYGSDRRTYPDERPPPNASLPPPTPVAPPRVEKKPETKNAEDILKPPGRATRPDRIVVIMRGLPGSGKSHVAKLIRDKEVECGGAPPRVLGLDDYFMTEVEKVEKDPDTGKRVKNKVLEYEYEPEMEDTYRSSMLKTFKKTLDDGFFPFIILDAINDRVKYFDQFWSAAKTKGFEVYLAEITADHQTCAKRNIHGRTLKDITKLANGWESAPPHMVRLDIRSLLQDAAIEDVEMEDFNPSEEELKAELRKDEEDETDLGYLPKSKWEMDTSEAKLDKLDGLAGGGKRKRNTMSGMEDFLQLPDDYASRMSEPGKKRVRWADLEEQKDADRKRAIGFVVGQTDWEKITDESGQIAQRALNRTKYF